MDTKTLLSESHRTRIDEAMTAAFVIKTFGFLVLCSSLVLFLTSYIKFFFKKIPVQTSTFEFMVAMIGVSVIFTAIIAEFVMAYNEHSLVKKRYHPKLRLTVFNLVPSKKMIICSGALMIAFILERFSMWDLAFPFLVLACILAGIIVYRTISLLHLAWSGGGKGLSMEEITDLHDRSLVKKDNAQT